MGAQAYDMIDDFANVLQGSVVEIGTCRGEGSTEYLSTVCKKTGNKFYTVDFDMDRLDWPDTHQFRITGEEFFEKHFPADEKVCFAYLDGFDWAWQEPEDSRASEQDLKKWSQMVEDQTVIYQRYGIVMNNENSQLSHLTLAKAVAEQAAKKCVILIDDTFGVDGNISGKGGTAYTWLVKQGWHEIAVDHHAAKAFRNWK